MIRDSGPQESWNCRSAFREQLCMFLVSSCQLPGSIAMVSAREWQSSKALYLLSHYVLVVINYNTGFWQPRSGRMPWKPSFIFSGLGLYLMDVGLLHCHTASVLLNRACWRQKGQWRTHIWPWGWGSCHVATAWAWEVLQCIMNVESACVCLQSTAKTMQTSHCAGTLCRQTCLPRWESTWLHSDPSWC